MKKIAKMLFAASALLFLLEIGLRVGLGLGNPVLFEPSADYGYFPVANQDVTRFGSHVVINHAGMRSAEFADTKANGTRRILFVGDSVSFGPTYVGQDEIFPTVVRTEKNRKSVVNWESLNASAPGWAVGNELGFIKSRGIFEADLVVLVINTGDLMQPFSVIDGTGSFPYKRPPLALDEALFRYGLPKLGLAPGTSADHGSTGDATNALPVSEVLASISEFRSIVEHSGARFILLYTPAIGDEWHKPIWTAAHESLDKWARETNCDLVDFSSALNDADPNQNYFDGIHLRPTGHAIVARKVVSKLNALN
ncbi:SGNH/GDSL hydrolase family protein [Caballeronia arvi]|nr:SGNH/GDSL hydrolase family protein [Caballeronia arvi]